MLEVIADAFGVKPPSLPIPAWPVQLLGSCVELVCIPLGIEPPIYRRRVDFFTKTRAFNGEKAHRMLGFVPSASFEEEVREIAAWYRKEGWIRVVKSSKSASKHKAAA